MTVIEQEPMNRHTTFRTGGPARWFCPVSSVEEMLEVHAFAETRKLPLYVIGRGSNLLVSDQGINGVVMEIGEGFQKISVREERITADAGTNLAAVAQAAKEAGLSGMEFASGIPGTLGGGIYMNAGAYGGEMKDIVESVEVIRPDRLRQLSEQEDASNINLNKMRIMDQLLERISGEDMHFAYRHSRCHEEKLVVVRATLKLTPGNKADIAAEMQRLNQCRRDKQPLEYPSAGSTFKRPEGYFAGKLIQDAGLKGFTIGGASVSEKHSGFVINRGGATSQDVYRVICHVQDEVERQFGVRLEPEVRMLGAF